MTRRVGVVLALAGALAGAAAGSGGDGARTAPNVAVALFADGDCGAFAASLPPLVTRTGLRPDDEVADVTVCVANTGRGAGHLRLGVAERVELETACSADEAGADDTCGGGGPGELGPALVQELGVGRCSRRGPPFDAALRRRLPELESPLALAEPLVPGAVACVRLRLHYTPAGTVERVQSQSDATSWRYVFELATAG